MHLGRYLKTMSPSGEILSISVAQELTTGLLGYYGKERLHTGIGGVPPRRLLMAA